MKRQILFAVDDACYIALSNCTAKERSYMMRALRLIS